MKAAKVEVLTGPQGGGKSETMRTETLANSGFYLFALPTTELIDEQVRDFFRADSSFMTRSIYAKPGSKGSTVKRLSEARAEIEASGAERAAIFTTHATLMDHDVEGFDGWHARIDEAPAAVQAGHFNIGLTLRKWARDNFDLLSRPGDEWSLLRLKTNRPNWRDVQRDSGAQQLGEFIKQAGRPERVFVRARSWDETDDIRWFSMWTPLSLAHMRSVQIAGTGYTESIGWRTAHALYEDLLGVSKREIAPPRTGQPAITLHYFTRGHSGTTTFWKSPEGLRLLAPICDHLRKALDDRGFWSGNKIVEEVFYGFLDRAEFIKPMAMGLNKCREKTQCAFIFSGKATPEDQPVMEVFGLTREDIERARETETIGQFIMRGAIRNRDFDGSYDVYLHSELQACRMRDHLHRIGFDHVALNALEEAGIMTARRNDERADPEPEEAQVREGKRLARDAERHRTKRGDRAVAEGRTPAAKGSKGGRPKGSKDKQPRARRTRSAT